MAIHTDRIVLVFPIAAKNRLAAASLQTLEITESGREFEELVPLDPSLVNDYANEFNLGALGQVATLESDLSTAIKTLEQTTTAKTRLESQVDTLTTDLATANRTIDQLQSRVNFLESIKPFNDGLIKIESFMERCKPYMSRLMFAANDEIPANGFGDIVSILNAKSKIGEPVNLNSTMFAWAIGKIRTLNDVTEEEIATLTRPASREEAFIEASGE